jgi:hypothetical protein
MSMYTILIAVEVPTTIAKKANAYATINHLSNPAQNKMICCVVEKYVPANYPQLEELYPEVVQDCSPTDDCEAILAPAGL